MNTYEKRVRRYEREGLTRSDAQGAVEAEDMKSSMVSAETADTMHSTITKLMRENEMLLEALKTLLPFVQGDIGKAGIKALDKAEKAITKAESHD